MELVQKVRRQIIYFDNFSKSRGSDISVSQVDVDLFVFWTIAAKTGINNGVIGSSVYVTAGPIRDIVQMIDPELLQVFYQILRNPSGLVCNQHWRTFGQSLLFAILLSRIKKGRVALQTLYYIPVVISSVAICQIFTKLFSVTPIGIVNQILSFVNPSFKFMEWISNPQVSLYVAAFVEAYKYLGLYMVIFYAALIGVPDELGEAALIDGAAVWQEYLYVKIPYIKPVIIANCLLVLNGSLRSFEFSYLLTHGGPGNASELMTTYMYKQAFSSMKYGYGSAVAIMIVIICMVVGLLFRKFSEQGEDE